MGCIFKTAVPLRWKGGQSRGKLKYTGFSSPPPYFVLPLLSFSVRLVAVSLLLLPRILTMLLLFLLDFSMFPVVGWALGAAYTVFLLLSWARSQKCLVIGHKICLGLAG